VDEVRPFMGLAGYYERFIRNFSKIVYPITSLQRKVKKFEWTKECSDNFDHLKNFLTNAQVLNIVDPKKEFVVCIDAFKKGHGVVVKEGHVI